jgi:ATP-dependent RNA helicase DeaD
MEEQKVTFDSFNFSKEISGAIKKAGFKVASPIQAMAIPLIQAGHDIIAQAHTGTGKTAAFSLPILDMMENIGFGVECLVVTPTRELANQISDEMYRLGADKGIKTATVYGGQSYNLQRKRVNGAANVVVATPGRLLDMLSKEQFKEFNPRFVVLDEADEMLNMGFLEDVKEIFTYLPQNRQTLMFSATMPKEIRNLANSILVDPKTATVTKEETTNKDITQEYYVIEEHERDDAMVRLLDALNPDKSIIFCRMKKEVDRVSEMLSAKGHSAVGLHGDMEQRERDRVIGKFKKNEADILVATDVAARGLDISNVSHVFNYHIPFDPESYVHRIGRTGRAGQKGLAVTLVTPLEYKELTSIQKKVKSNLTQSFIPTAKEAGGKTLQTLAQKVKEQPIDDNAQALYELLSDELDSTQLNFKLLSMLLEKKKFDGPERIGLSAQKLEAVLSQLQQKEQAKKSKRNGRRNSRRGGGSNSSKRGDSNNSSRNKNHSKRR